MNGVYIFWDTHIKQVARKSQQVWWLLFYNFKTFETFVITQIHPISLNIRFNFICPFRPCSLKLCLPLSLVLMKSWSQWHIWDYSNPVAERSNPSVKRRYVVGPIFPYFSKDNTGSTHPTEQRHIPDDLNVCFMCSFHFPHAFTILTRCAYYNCTNIM